MDWAMLAEHLTEATNVSFRIGGMPAAQWAEREAMPEGGADTKLLYGDWHVKTEERAEWVSTLSAPWDKLSGTERQLVLLLVRQAQLAGRPQPGKGVSSEERLMTSLGAWLLERPRTDETGTGPAALPAEYGRLRAFQKGHIPFLISGAYSDARSATYAEFKKLLESFFDTDVILIPLHHKEWLALTPEEVLTASESEEENVEELLASVASGLYEMMESEWVGECHISAGYPIVPESGLAAAVHELLEAAELGRKFNVSANVHLPWELRLEKFILAVPERERAQFLARVLRRGEQLLDAESTQTLETFFEMDCNVSETAKRLYIHRNTLLYRLDKIKHETGLDVRTFRGATLMMLALLLYKVTKRNSDFL